MKRLQAVKMGVLGYIMLVLLSCSKIRDVGNGGGNTTNQQEYISVSATIYINQPYEYDLSNWGSTGSVVIIKQALHYTVSTSYNAGGRLIYRYVPASNFIGQDEVILRTQSGTAGNALKITNITINIDVYR